MILSSKFRHGIALHCTTANIDHIMYRMVCRQREKASSLINVNVIFPFSFDFSPIQFVQIFYRIYWQSSKRYKSNKVKVKLCHRMVNVNVAPTANKSLFPRISETSPIPNSCSIYLEPLFFAIEFYSKRWYEISNNR